MNEPEASQIRTFSVRLEQWLYDKLTAAAGQKTKNEYIKAVLIAHLDAPKMNKNEQKTNHEKTINEPGRDLLKEVELKNDIIKSKDQTIRNLEIQTGFLISEFQRMSSINERLLLPAAQGEQMEKRRRHFWEIWK